MAIFTGSGVALVTPFTDSGVDFEALGRLIEFQIENGSDALISLGTTGEPPTMSPEERQSVIEFTIKKSNGRVPVIASTGGNNTQEVIHASQLAEKAGADGLLVVTPYYNKCTQNGLVAHYNAVADSVNIPIIVYNVPSRTGVNVQAETLERISHHPNIAGMKEASGNIGQVSDMIRLCKDNLSVYSGDDGVVLPLMALGGVGVISVVANILPKAMHDLTDAMAAGDYAKARALQHGMDPIIHLLFCEVNPIPVKAALGMLGMCSDRVRLPLTPMEDAHKQALKQAMQAYGMQV